MLPCRSQAWMLQVQVNCARCLSSPFQATVYAYQGFGELCGWRILGICAYERKKLKLDAQSSSSVVSSDYKFPSFFHRFIVCLLASIAIDFFFIACQQLQQLVGHKVDFFHRPGNLSRKLLVTRYEVTCFLINKVLYLLLFLFHLGPVCFDYHAPE